MDQSIYLPAHEEGSGEDHPGSASFGAGTGGADAMSGTGMSHPHRRRRLAKARHDGEEAVHEGGEQSQPSAAWGLTRLFESADMGRRQVHQVIDQQERHERERERQERDHGEEFRQLAERQARQRDELLRVLAQQRKDMTVSRHVDVGGGVPLFIDFPFFDGINGKWKTDHGPAGNDVAAKLGSDGARLTYESMRLTSVEQVDHVQAHLWHLLEQNQRDERDRLAAKHRREADGLGQRQDTERRALDDAHRRESGLPERRPRTSEERERQRAASASRSAPVSSSGRRRIRRGDQAERIEPSFGPSSREAAHEPAHHEPDHHAHALPQAPVAPRPTPLALRAPASVVHARAV